MVSFLKFWWAAIRQTLGFGWVVIGIVSTLLPMGVSLIQKHWPALAAVPLIKWIADNQVEIQLGVAASFLIPYLLYAPYRIYKEQGAKLATLEARGGNQEILEKLGEFLAEGEQFKSICHNPTLEIFPGDQIALWANKLDSYLTSKLGASYAVRVKSASGLGSPFATTLAPGLTQRHWLPVHIRCVRLNQFISELSYHPKSAFSNTDPQQD